MGIIKTNNKYANFKPKPYYICLAIHCFIGI